MANDKPRGGLMGKFRQKPPSRPVPSGPIDPSALATLGLVPPERPPARPSSGLPTEASLASESEKKTAQTGEAKVRTLVTCDKPLLSNSNTEHTPNDAPKESQAKLIYAEETLKWHKKHRKATPSSRIGLFSLFAFGIMSFCIFKTAFSGVTRKVCIV